MAGQTTTDQQLQANQPSQQESNENEKQPEKKKKGKSKPRKLTPMLERFFEVKEQHPGTILLFRMGDFYELFFDDAVIAAKVLGLTLTSRDKNSDDPVPMAGFPYHSLDNYLHKLIHAGHRTAICDQVEDPKQAKGLVKREVTRIVTAGTLIEDALLDPRESNFLVAIATGKNAVGLAWLELSTGRFQLSQILPGTLADELARLHPAEALYNREIENTPLFIEATYDLKTTQLTDRPAWSFIPNTCQEILCKHFGTNTLEGFDIEEDSLGIVAAGVLMEYVQETQRTSLAHITSLEPYRSKDRMLIDEATRRSLELTHTLREGKREGTLLDILDETVSPMGARLLADWLSNPLICSEQIRSRADAVEELTQQSQLLGDLREQLDQTYDLQRLATRIATGRCSPRDLVWLAKTLSLLPKTKQLLAESKAGKLQELEAGIDLCEEVREDIDSILVDDPPLLITEGGMIRDGHDARLDELRGLSKGGKEWIAKYQAEEIERTGIQNLKVGYNRVFGYYLEVTAAQIDKVPEDYIRKQTLKNQERFITPQLKEYEEKVLTADQQSIALEAEIFQQLRLRVANHLKRLQRSAETLAQLDVLSSFAHTAMNRGYTRPEITNEITLDIREGRHPVLDAILPAGQFVPNDVKLESKSNSQSSPTEISSAQTENVSADENRTREGAVQIITGPNMAGKSTYIRQAALITLLAQTGSFVPASEARIGIADRIFARVGASDELSKGQSTFMVEMTETARILNTATEKSLVILDEIGRGTSTYDGLSLAWAVTEYLHDVVQARTMFATHYHELTELEQTLPAVRNWNVSVHEHQGSLVFLHKIVPGAADKSYGIHVARLAGVPGDVISRAGEILVTLEQDHLDEQGKPNVPPRQTQSQIHKQLTLFEPPPHPILEKIKQLDLDGLTPKAALDQLYKLRDEL